MAKQNKPPRKPTGEIRATTLEVGGNQPAALSKIETFKLPEVKNEAEDVIMQNFVMLSRQDNARDHLVRLESATHLPTDHGPDFEVTFDSGEFGYFELLEIAPLLGRYEDANRVMLVGEFIDFIVNQIEKKIRKYSERKQFRPIYLLLYASHDGFSPGPLETRGIIDTMLSLSNEVFNAIYLEILAHDGSPWVAKLWPFKGRHFTKSELTGHRRRQIIRTDPTQIKIIADNSHGNRFDVTIRQYLPKGVDLAKIKKGVLSDEEYLRMGLPLVIKTRS